MSEWPKKKGMELIERAAEETRTRVMMKWREEIWEWSYFSQSRCTFSLSESSKQDGLDGFGVLKKKAEEKEMDCEEGSLEPLDDEG